MTNTATPETPGLLSVTEAAAVMRVSRATAYRLARSGEMPALRIGGQYRIPADELHKWMYSGPPLTVDELEAELGRDREWLNAQALTGLPCQWTPRGEVVSVRREDLPQWLNAVKREEAL